MHRVLLIIALMWSTFSIAQSNWYPADSTYVKAQKCFIDPLNRIYAIRKGEIELRDAELKLLTKYSNKLIGEDILIDVSNPLKVLVYSPDQMKLIFLDSRLGELQDPINLMSKGFEQISLAATSYNNGFWLYDPINFQLIRFNQNYEEERRSLNIGQLLRKELYPADIIERNNKVYISDPNLGILVFDAYANYINTLPIKGIDHLVITNDKLLFQKKGMLHALDLKDYGEENLNLSLINNAFFDANRSRIIAHKKNHLIIFTTNN